jgi:hypothetical protein
MSASLQYYGYLESPLGLVNYILERLSGTSSERLDDAVLSLIEASYIDIDYDAISHTVVLNAFWEKAQDYRSWTETTSLSTKDETIEIGVLSHEPNPDPEAIAFAGFLTVLGQDTKPSTSTSLPLISSTH